MLARFFEWVKPVNTHPIIRRIFPEAIWDIDASGKVVYLTFDDGPQDGVTQQVLALLKQYGAKATFFCIGENVMRNPAIYNQILVEGHTVGNHTYNHLKGSTTDDELYFYNIKQCAELVDSNLFRPPFGRMKHSQYKKLKEQYKIVMWSVLSWDFDLSFTPQQCADKVINNVQNGSVIVFHDSKKAENNCIPALEQVLNTLYKKGYNFLSLENKIK